MGLKKHLLNIEYLVDVASLKILPIQITVDPIDSDEVENITRRLGFWLWKRLRKQAITIQ
jgi:hypothetical protein